MTPVITSPGEACWAVEYDPTTFGSHSDRTGLDRKSICKKNTQAQQTLGTALAGAHHEARLIKEIKMDIVMNTIYLVEEQQSGKCGLLGISYGALSHLKLQYSYLSLSYAGSPGETRHARTTRHWWPSRKYTQTHINMLVSMHTCTSCFYVHINRQCTVLLLLHQSSSQLIRQLITNVNSGFTRRGCTLSKQHILGTDCSQSFDFFMERVKTLSHMYNVHW